MFGIKPFSLKKLSLFCILTIFIVSQQIQASEPFKMLTFNVFMLPKPIKFSLQNERTDVLVDYFKKSNYDVIFLQEAFTENFRSQLTNELKKNYPYNYYLEKDEKFLSFLGSGLMVLSRKPFNVLGHIYFNKCRGFDCLASKGALLIEVFTSENKKLQIASTHLQAGVENTDIRKLQLDQIKNLFLTHAQKDSLQLLVGDLNISSKADFFQETLNNLGMKSFNFVGKIKTTNSRENPCYKTDNKKIWIDHVLIEKNFAETLIEMKVKDLNFTHNGKECPASDHHAIEAFLK